MTILPEWIFKLIQQNEINKQTIIINKNREIAIEKKRIEDNIIAEEKLKKDIKRKEIFKNIDKIIKIYNIIYDLVLIIYIIIYIYRIIKYHKIDIIL